MSHIFEVVLAALCLVDLPFFSILSKENAAMVFVLTDPGLYAGLCDPSSGDSSFTPQQLLKQMAPGERHFSSKRCKLQGRLGWILVKVVWGQ